MEWFLINENEHLGPFSEEVIHELHQSGEILNDSLLWREGWSDAKTYETIFLADEASFKPINTKLEKVYDSPPAHSVIKEDEMPPELPPEAIKFNEKIQQIKSNVIKNKQESNHKQEPKQQPQQDPTASRSEKLREESLDQNKEPIHIESTEELSQPELKTHNMEEFEEEIDVEEVFEYDFDVASSEKRLQIILRKAFIIVLTLIIVGPIFLYISKNEEVFSRPRTMSLEDYEKLSETATNQSPDLKFSFSLATDKRTLWIATNIALEGEVFINLKSKQGRTLGGLVEIKAKGILEKRLITLTEFQFIQGSRFVDGYYDAELYTVDDLEEPFYNRFFEPREKQFRYLNDVLITSLHPAEFKKLLEKKNTMKNSNESRFWEKLKEEYKTVKSITAGIKEEVDILFNKPKEAWGESIKSFEESYKSNYGVFFTSFVINVDKQFEVLNAKEFPNKTKIISHYTKLKKLAVEIGEETLIVMENLKSHNILSMSTEKIQDLKYSSTIKYKLIIKECDDMIDQL